MRAAILLLAALTIPAQAQWTIQTPTKADLRGIDNVGKSVAWASGTNGTVLRTEDAGYLWQTCTIPPGAEHLDFRGIQAFDANTAIVMSSGTGNQSRLYKTTDGCQTWTLLFTNPDKDGFWDGLFLVRDFDEVFILGDPVNGKFRLFSALMGEDLKDPPNFSDNWNGHAITAIKGQAAFAASNSLFAESVDDACSPSLQEGQSQRSFMRNMVLINRRAPFRSGHGVLFPSHMAKVQVPSQLPLPHTTRRPTLGMS